MRLNLNRVAIEFHPKPFHNPLGKRRPVDIGCGRQVGVVVADSAIHLGAWLNGKKRIACNSQSLAHVGNFFAQGGGRSGLAMGA